VDIRLSEIGTSLGTRDLGAKIRTDLEIAMSGSVKINVDFTGVNVMSNSFADECFGKLLFRYEIAYIKNKLSFINANSFVKLVLLNSFRQRQTPVAVENR